MAAQKIRIHPGEILREEFLVPLGVSAHHLAISLDLPPKHVSAVVNVTALSQRI